MKLPLPFRRKRAIETRPRQEAMELRLSHTLRMMSQWCSRVADFLDAQRLERQGFSNQGQFLKRLDEDKKS